MLLFCIVRVLGSHDWISLVMKLHASLSTGFDVIQLLPTKIEHIFVFTYEMQQQFIKSNRLIFFQVYAFYLKFQKFSLLLNMLLILNITNSA